EEFGEVAPVIESQVRQYESKAREALKADEQAELDIADVARGVRGATSGAESMRRTLLERETAEAVCARAESMRREVETNAGVLEQRDDQLAAGLKAAGGYIAACSNRRDVAWARDELYPAAKDLVTAMERIARNARSQNDAIKQALPKAKADSAAYIEVLRA